MLGVSVVTLETEYKGSHLINGGSRSLRVFLWGPIILDCFCFAFFFLFFLALFSVNHKVTASPLPQASSARVFCPRVWGLVTPDGVSETVSQNKPCSFEEQDLSCF